MRSAAVLLPVAVLAIWAGGIWFSLFAAALLVLMAWEWAGLCAPRQIAVVAATAIIGIVIVAIIALGLYWPAVAIGGLGAIVVGAAVKERPMADRFLAAFGVVYLSTACAGAVWLRGSSESGFWMVLWLVLVIVGTDVGAYAAGRTIGGAKLAPRISPNKTWAGLFGGAAVAAAAGAATAPALGIGIGRATAVSIGLACVAQAGDLFESHLKRRAGVKDSGSLIPGHGGVLDRLDGVLAAIPAFLALVAVGGAD